MGGPAHIWLPRILAKALLLPIPAFGALWYWKRHGIDNRILYYVCCGDSAFYLLWLALLAAGIVKQYHADLPFSIDYRLSPYEFVFIPLFSTLGSFVLFMASLGVKRASAGWLQ